MRNLTSILIVFLVFNVKTQATNYFVNSISGNDSNSGTNSSAPWKSLAAVNSKIFQPGDVVNFARSSVWNGELMISANGSKKNPIIFKTYGTGNITFLPTIMYTI